MTLPFVYLCIQTLLLWFLIIFLHRQKKYITLIPLYTFIAVLTLLTHNLSDLGFAVIVNQWFFLISSFSFFTALMLGILFIYLFEGPRATRLALFVILLTSFFYIGVVAALGAQVNTTSWILLTPKRLTYYFWSISAIIIDVFFIAICWEFLERFKKIPFLARIFFIIFGTYSIDTLIFVSGVFGSQPIFLSVLAANIITRLALSLIAAPIVGYFLKAEGYHSNEENEKKNVWEILNFRSDLETRILSMEDSIERQKELEKQLNLSQEKYMLALEGTNAGIWDWDIVNNNIMYSSRFCHMLGYKKEELLNTLEEFKKILHPADTERTFAQIEECFKTKTQFTIEYRLKTKEGKYKWYLNGGITKFDESNKPIRMVGSIIDIDEKKQLVESYKEKVEELEKVNKLMVGRELQMLELKEELALLKKNSG